MTGPVRLPLSADLVDPASARVAIVLSRTNDFITEKLCEGAVGELRSRFVGDVVVVEVAGAFELVAAARRVLDDGFHGVVAIGVVIRGNTPHFEYISSAVTDGLTLIASEGRAVTFGVLTVDTIEQAAERAGGALGNKGAEAALALLQMLSAFERLPGKPVPGRPAGDSTARRHAP